MDIYQKSLLTRSISIPMTQMGGNVEAVLKNYLIEMEGKCGEEGYIKKKSIQIFNYSCGVIKGSNVIVQVVFECQIANPMPDQIFTCIVEHNTRAGIKARLNSSEDSPFIVFLARDHHNTIAKFSEIKENEKIKVNVLGQRFEINDPQISIIATLVTDEFKLEPESIEPISESLSNVPSESGEDEIIDSSDMQRARMLVDPESPPYHVSDKEKEPESPPYHVPDEEKEPESPPYHVPDEELVPDRPNEPELTNDILVFNSKSAHKPPGKGTQENTKDTYPELSKIKDWRKQLSHFDVAEFSCEGSNGIVFPPGSRWKTLEHYWQASKLSLVDQEFANLLRIGEKYGNGDGNEARALRKGILKGPDKHPVVLSDAIIAHWNKITYDVMYVAAKAKFSQNADKLEVLCATKKATLMHLISRVKKDESLVRFTHYERVRSELC